MENSLNAHAVASPYYRGLRDTTYGGVTDKDVELNSPPFGPYTFNTQHKSEGFHSRLSRLWKLLGLSSASAEEVTPEETTNDDSLIGHPYNPSVTVFTNFSPPNQQPLSESLPTLHELGIDVNQDDIGYDQGSGDPFEAFIDIWDENEYILDDATAHQLTHQAWKDHINELKRSGVDDSSMKMMSETAAALGGQAIGVVVANALANGPTASTSSWAVYCVEFVIMLGLCCTVAGIGLRRRHRAMSVLMTKVGAVATISAIIFPLASHLPPVMTWTVGPLAFLVSAFAVALA